MNNVRKHMEKVFSKYPQTAETADLKEEVIGNLKAEIEDLQKSGLSFEEAFHRSIEKVPDLEGLIEGVQFFSVRKMVFEMLQWSLIYTLVAWILTIPLSVLGPVRKTSWLLFIIILMIGSVYFLLYLLQNQFLTNSFRMDLFKITKLKKRVWIVWFVFQLISWVIITGLHFGSDLWFWRGITINGPYEFAILGVSYAIPMISIIIPLLMNKLEMLAGQYAGGDVSNEA